MSKKNPFTKKAKKNPFSQKSTKSKAKSNTALAVGFGAIAGPLSTPYSPKHKLRKSQVDTSKVKRGDNVIVGWTDPEGVVRKHEGQVTYADGLWLNVKDEIMSWPVYRPHITSLKTI